MNNIEHYDQELVGYDNISTNLIMRKFKLNETKAEEIYDQLQEIRYGRHVKEQVKFFNRIDKLRKTKIN